MGLYLGSKKKSMVIDGNYKDGYEIGYNAGITVGYTNGYSTGKEDGFENGQNATYDNGYKDGSIDGGKVEYTDVYGSIVSDTLDELTPSNFTIVSTAEELMSAIDSNFEIIFIKSGTYLLDNGIYINRYLQLIGLGETKDDVIISFTTSAVITDFNTNFHIEPSLDLPNIPSPIKIKNLSVKNDENSSVTLVKIYRDSVIFDNVNFYNYAKRPVLEIGRAGRKVKGILKCCNMYNYIAGSSLSPNSHPLVQLRYGANVSLSKYCYLETSQLKAPSISVVYSDGDAIAVSASRIDIDSTLESKHNSTNGIIIYSATPSNKWIDEIVVNGVHLTHIDSNSKGGASSIEGWNAFDANDWDNSILGYTINYNGYLYTNNLDLKPDDYIG